MHVILLRELNGLISLGTGLITSEDIFLRVQDLKYNKSSNLAFFVVIVLQGVTAEDVT